MKRKLIINFQIIFSDCYHLKDQVDLLTYKIQEYEKLKDNLIKINDENFQKKTYIEKLEKEIKNYKSVTESCVKTCSHLTEELGSLRKGIEKYTKAKNYKKDS